MPALFTPQDCPVIIFDLDGTLVNAYPAVASSVNYTLKRMGFKPKSAHAIRRAVGWGDRQLMARFVGDKKANEAIRLYRPHHTKALRTGVRFLSGAKTVLSKLYKAGYTLAIATNRPSKFTHIILKELGVRNLFAHVVCADEVRRGKPAPDMINRILKSAKAVRSEALFVGDMTIDLDTGRNARVRTVAVATGSSTTKELKQLKPHALIARISLLKNTLQY